MILMLLAIFANPFLQQSPSDLTVQRLIHEGTTGIIGKALFTVYVLPFEIISIMLLVAIVGAVLLARKDIEKIEKEQRLMQEIFTNIIQPNLIHYLILGAVLFVIGLYGLFTSRNVIRVLMCIEILLNSVNINMVAFANYSDPNLIRGDVFALFIMAVAAAEAAVGFALVLAIYRNKKYCRYGRFRYS